MAINTQSFYCIQSSTPKIHALKGALALGGIALAATGVLGILSLTHVGPGINALNHLTLYGNGALVGVGVGVVGLVLYSFFKNRKQVVEYSNFNTIPSSSVIDTFDHENYHDFSLTGFEVLKQGSQYQFSRIEEGRKKLYFYEIYREETLGDLKLINHLKEKEYYFEQLSDELGYLYCKTSVGWIKYTHKNLSPLVLNSKEIAKASVSPTFTEVSLEVLQNREHQSTQA